MSYYSSIIQGSLYVCRTYGLVLHTILYALQLLMDLIFVYPILTGNCCDEDILPSLATTNLISSLLRLLIEIHVQSAVVEKVSATPFANY